MVELQVKTDLKRKRDWKVMLKIEKAKGYVVGKGLVELLKMKKKKQPGLVELLRIKKRSGKENYFSHWPLRPGGPHGITEGWVFVFTKVA